MTHTHREEDVRDTDPLFKIDPITRLILNKSNKTILMQNDHNSERFTFEIPKYVEGHDMSLCDRVQIHYQNVGQTKAETIEGIYDVTDLTVNVDSNNVVTFSWLISGNVTKYAGALKFVVNFACTNNGEVKYSWDTEIYSDITIKATIHNSDVMVLEYADVLEEWKERLFDINDSGLSAVEDAVSAGVTELEETGKDILHEMTIKGDATTAKSWAVGGTGTRAGEDTNNSWYWALESAKSAVEAKEAVESVGNIEVSDTSNISGGGAGSKMQLQKFLDAVGNWLTTKVITHTNFLDKLKNSGDTTDKGYALDARYGKTISDSIQKIHSVVSVTLRSADWTGDAAPYTQTVFVEGVSDKDEPMMVSLLDKSATADVQKSYSKAYGIIASGTGETWDGAVTFRVFKKPATDITVGLTHLRGDI